MSSFQGKVAAITGAASGIGRALAYQLAEEGCHLALADVQQDALEETAAEAKRRGQHHNIQVTTNLVDVASREAIEGWAQEVMHSHHAVHLLFNNAGVTVIDTAEDVSYEDFAWIVDINFWGVVYGCKTFLPHLRMQEEAYIVNTSSVFGLISVPGQSTYNATKFAVRGFSEALHQELLDTSIHVACVHPGGIQTAITKNARHHARPGLIGSHERSNQQFEKIARTTPEKAASIILRGIRKKKRRIRVGTDAYFIDWFQRLFPSFYMKAVAKIARKRFLGRHSKPEDK